MRASPPSSLLISILTGVVLAGCLVFGGASRQNAFQVIGLELLSLPLLFCALWRHAALGSWGEIRGPGLIVLAIVGIVLLQLVPLPPAIWNHLPGHAPAAEALRLAGLDRAWRPYSLTPEVTARYGLALLPPIAVFLGAGQMHSRQRLWLSLLIPLAAAISLGVGVAQLLGDPEGPLYFYANTNRDSAVGLFANRNHQAALLVACLPFAALWLRPSEQSRGRPPIGPLLVMALFGIVIIGLIVLRSRAGVLLLVPSLLASLALTWRGGLAFNRWMAAGLGAIVVGAIVLGLLVGFGPLKQRFETKGEGRAVSAPIAAGAAWALQPLGGGLGSFRNIYAGAETNETMFESYWLHVHDDYLELWLEAGWLALATLLGFLVWWSRAAVSAWRGPPDLPGSLARAASVASGLLLIHSAVDYPLRTLAMACVFAFACGVMVRRSSPAEARGAAAIGSGPSRRAIGAGG
ncbi:O-antigen ligase [Caulobacter ginsengisoli]|uniref:O-antigen ligase n=1 Tax=Caulobacter ginsengisoli TaxID=400775 RepID=A0ABU0IM63_9CAUL|nr:O-antigen ligase family protein [Caulobacter ginsengisoli]MDQ0463106.1 O-antigen ligase [Caulobacter ginsengisoli]